MKAIQITAPSEMKVVDIEKPVLTGRSSCEN